MTPSADLPVATAVAPVPAAQGEPGAAGAHPRPRRGRTLPLLAGTDGSTVLTAFIVLLFAIPSSFVVGPLGGAGTPAQLLGLAAALWWLVRYFSRYRSHRPVSQPVRRGMLLFCLVVMTSYLIATVRPIEYAELLNADRGLLSLCSWLGLVLVAGDLIPSRKRLDVLLRRVALGGGMLGLLGIAQFETGRSFVEYLRLPGLTASSMAAGVSGRDGFNRPAGTATHPIEFGVVLSMLLPLTLHYALADKEQGRLRRWFPVAGLALCIPASVSRSAVVCTGIALAFVLPTWQRKIRRVAYAAIAALGAFVFVAMPGMIGTMVGLFSGIGSDTSAQSRVGSYAIAGQFIERAPVFGRGFATFLPIYHILDNQYLGVLIELGVAGLVSLLALFLTGILVARRIRRRSTDPSTRSLGQALAASLAAGAASFALFDAFSFAMTAGLVFFVLGMIGALHRLQALGIADPGTQPDGPEPEGLVALRSLRTLATGSLRLPPLTGGIPLGTVPPPRARTRPGATGPAPPRGLARLRGRHATGRPGAPG